MSEGKFRQTIAQMVNQCCGKYVGCGAEIGVAEGKLSEVLLRRFPKLVLHMVDQWRGNLPADSRYRLSGDVEARKTGEEKRRQCMSAVERVSWAGFRAVIHPLSSLEAVERFEDGHLDFLIIDSEHTREAVLEDTEAWWPKLKSGGLVVWHDFDNPPYPGVREAVLELSEKYRLTVGANPGFVAGAVKP